MCEIMSEPYGVYIESHFFLDGGEFLIPNVWRKDDSDNWFRTVRNPEAGKKRGARKRIVKKVGPLDVARELADYGCVNLISVVMGVHYFCPGGPGRKTE